MSEFGSIQVREGDLVAGKYRIGRVLGVGGMGVVVAAQHEQLEQPVAIKFVRDDALDNDDAVERFLREARSAARLRSEHVARVLDVGRLESGAPYMVMEFLEGSDLSKALTRDGPMAVDTAAGLMLQVCEAVAEAHSAGIVHRDLKPENLFLTKTVGGTPKVKVLDFGVSKSMRLGDDSKRKLTGTRAMLGSPLYMAPEQMRSSRDVDARTDVWSLGVVLFELLTGRSPFEAETMPELCLKIVNEPPTPLVSLRPVIPPGLAAVVDRCLEKDRTRRYANAAELALALEPFAPPRSSAFSVRSAFEALRALPPRVGDLVATIPADAPPAVTAPQTASIPAAWGTEGVRLSQQAPRKPSAAGPWAAAVALVLGLSAIVVATRLSSVARQPHDAQPAAAPPPVVAIPPAMPQPATLAPEPPAAEPPAPAPPAIAEPEAPATAKPAESSPPRRAASPPVPAAHPAPLARAASPSSAPAPDEDIPSLR